MIQRFLNGILSEANAQQVHHLIVGQRVWVAEKALQHSAPCAKAMGSFFPIIHAEVLFLCPDRIAQGVGALYDLIEVRFIFVFLLAQFREGGA